MQVNRLVMERSAIEDVGDFIDLLRSKYSTQAATQFVNYLEQSLHRLAQFPDFAPRHNFRSLELQNVRTLTLPRFSRVCFYQVEAGRVQILRIVPGWNHVQDIFSEDVE